MSEPSVTDKSIVTTQDVTQQEDVYQVILHNDDVTPALYVVACLYKIFGHGKQLAFKIMLEAHERGSAVAEVEAETPAKLHRDQLQSAGLSATVEKL